MNVLSLFDGMSCGQIALERVGIKVDKYYASEIKRHAIQVTMKNYPDTIQVGDVTKVNSSDLPKIDLLGGGSLCQDFSQANKVREGYKGDKSSLFFEYVRLLKECNPKYFLLENVRMKKEHEDFISNKLGVKPIIINSSLVSAQLRHRLYWTNIPNITQPEDKKIILNDVLDCGYSDRYKARVLLESDSRPLKSPIKMAHRYFNTGFTTLIFKNKEHFYEVKKHFDLHFKGKTAKEIDLISKNIDLSIYGGVRYLTKNEREKCQTMPEKYTEILSDNDASCVLGDGWTVDVVAHILKGITEDK